jgi:hypothetical protein
LFKNFSEFVGYEPNVEFEIYFLNHFFNTMKNSQNIISEKKLSTNVITPLKIHLLFQHKKPQQESILNGAL